MKHFCLGIMFCVNFVCVAFLKKFLKFNTFKIGKNLLMFKNLNISFEWSFREL